MKVKELMTKKVLTVTPDDNVDRVFVLFHLKNIRHLPVLDKGKLVGILSDRDLKKLLGYPKKFVVTPDGTTFTIASRKVRSIMGKQVITIGPEQRAAEAAAIMRKRKIGALPVVRKKKLVGIITESDILKAFVKICNIVEPFGTPQKG